MNTKVHLTVLIDDDTATNFYNKIVLNKMQVTDRIETFQNGQEALDFLCSKDENGKYPQPDIIFLDINMPIMNGWEFLDHYKDLTDEQRAKIVITMLTSSANEDDKIAAFNTGIVKEYVSKPLAEQKLSQIIEKYFANN